MKKLLPIIIIYVILITSALLLAPGANANYYNTPHANTKFHPQNPEYYNGNHRLKLKKRADIERASATNVHYDKYNRDLFRCNWIYNKNLGTWVCEKDLLKYSHQPQEMKVCPVGYNYNKSYDRCDKKYNPALGPVPAASSTASVASNTSGNSTTIAQSQDIEVTQYVYIYDEEHVISSNTPRPTSLPSTGPSLVLMLVGSLLGGLRYISRLG